MKTALITIIVIILFLAIIPSSRAHEITTTQCRSYAAMHVFTTGLERLRLPAVKACKKKAFTHLMSHPLPNGEIPLILRRIRECESGGNYRAENSSSTASGAYQYLDSTWGGHRGYSRASDAPPRIQDIRAVRDYNNVGTTPWVSSISCWG